MRKTDDRPGRVALMLAALILPSLIACDDERRTPSVLPAKDVRVVTDGRFNEWAGLPLLFVDPEDAGAAAAVDLGEVRMADDSRWLHLAVDLRRRVNLQRMRGTLKVLFDADGESSTGAEVLDMPGVDLVVELSRRDRRPEDEVGAGNGIRPVTADGPGEVLTSYLVDLLSAPTHSASRFEIRLERRVVVEGLPSLFAGETVRVKLAFEDAGGVRDETDVATYRWASPRGREPSVVEPSIAKAGVGFRVVHWNVAGEAIRQRPEPFRRILFALDPDVVLFDEVYESVSGEDMEAFFGGDLLGKLGEWHVVVGGSGGRQKSVVASLGPIRPAEELLEVAYPSGELDRLAGEVDDPGFRELLEEERGRGVATAGAWVELDEGPEALFVPFDLQAAGYDGSPEDRLRELQALTLRNRIAAVVEALPDRGAPLVVAGDLNLVGSVRPLDLLRQGLDAGGAIDLAISEAYRLTDRSQATWRDAGYDFSPGRLDFLLFTSSKLESLRAFVFDEAELSDRLVGGLGLERGDSEAASPHLPGVADFRWSRARQ